MKYPYLIKIKIIIVFVAFFVPEGIAQQLFPDFNRAEISVEPVQEINTTGSEMSPFFVEDLFCFSAIPQKYWTSKRKKNNTAFYTIYSAQINQDGELTSGRKIVSGFGSPFHEGPADYCEKTGELFVTVSNIPENNVPENITGKVRLRLVVMKYSNGRWQQTEEFPYNNEKYNFAHPAISVTGDTLIFTSDLDTVGYGNSDLFMSIRKNGEWSVPVNLGEYINTPGNELFPTFLPGGYLSFATNGRTIRYGGLDIYYVAFPALNDVKIFRNGINSPFDDFGLKIFRNRRSGFFTSNRKPEYSDDIYRFEIVE